MPWNTVYFTRVLKITTQIMDKFASKMGCVNGPLEKMSNRYYNVADGAIHNLYSWCVEGRVFNSCQGLFFFLCHWLNYLHFNQLLNTEWTDICLCLQCIPLEKQVSLIGCYSHTKIQRVLKYDNKRINGSYCMNVWFNTSVHFM